MFNNITPGTHTIQLDPESLERVFMALASDAATCEKSEWFALQAGNYRTAAAIAAQINDQERATMYTACERVAMARHHDQIERRIAARKCDGVSCTTGDHAG